ncbi:MAG: hypothetical protein WCS92_02485 [Candidatus Babeliales bacterium]|jgi:hypothetical protein
MTNNTNTSLYTPEQEGIIRKKWLKSFTIYVSATIIDNLYSFNVIAFADFIGNKDLIDSYLVLISAFVIVATILWLHYYFGYKKRGTRLLAWITFVGWLKLIINIVNSIPEIKINFSKFGIINPIINTSYVLGIIVICAFVYYLINCSNLYKLNYSLKYGSKRDLIHTQTHSIEQNEINQISNEE